MSTARTSRLPPDDAVHEDLWNAVRPMDKHGLPLPRKFGLFPLLRVAVQAGVPMKVVPEEYWRQACDSQNRELQALIECTCGQTNVLPVGRKLVDCPGCQRWFFYAGSEVLVFIPA